MFFSYPARPDAPVLQGVTLIIPHGRTTALVGRSGAGKSTVAALLARFYEPQEGSICLGSTPADAFARGEWSKAVALVSQDPFLFAGTIADNIAYGGCALHSTALHCTAPSFLCRVLCRSLRALWPLGLPSPHAMRCDAMGQNSCPGRSSACHAAGPAWQGRNAPLIVCGAHTPWARAGKFGNASQEEIEAAATAANAHEFITKLPQGYRTIVGDRGALLSGACVWGVACGHACMHPCMSVPCILASPPAS